MSVHTRGSERIMVAHWLPTTEAPIETEAGSRLELLLLLLLLLLPEPCS